MLEKNKMNFSDLISKLEPLTKEIKKNNKDADENIRLSTLSRLFNVIAQDKNNDFKRANLINNINKVFNEKKIKYILEDSSYAGVFELLGGSFLILLLVLLGQFIDKFIIDKNIIIDGIIIILVCLFCVITGYLIKFLHGKMYSKIFSKRNDELIAPFNKEIKKVLGNKIFRVEYYYQLNKFDGGLENKRNLILLTYLIDKYGLEEKETKECALDYITRIPYYRSILNCYRDVKFWWFRKKTDKKVNWDELADSVNKLSDDYFKNKKS